MKFILFMILLLGTATLVLQSGYTFTTGIALMVLLSAVSMDFITTWLCLRVKGREGNPVIAFLFRKISVPGTFLLMAGIWTAFILLRWLPASVGIQTAVAVAYWLVPVNNVMVLARLRKKNHARAS